LRARLALFALALALSACARPGSGSAPAATAAPSGPRAVLPSGTVFHLELATTDAERAQGLMFRESLREDAGMLFLFDGTAIRPFWMKNCHFPLDIVHLTKDGTVVDVLPNVPPCAADPCPTYANTAPSDTVLEITAGSAAKNGLVVGAKVRFMEVPGR
jgi:uncharacterized membrane protein (UPF0127 family)